MNLVFLWPSITQLSFKPVSDVPVKELKAKTEHLTVEVQKLL